MAMDFDTYLSHEIDRHTDGDCDEHREDCDSWEGGECNCLDLDEADRGEALIARGEAMAEAREERGY